MADINQIITLGIGSPAGIPEFLTFGLQIGESAFDWTEACIWIIEPESNIVSLTQENNVYLVPACPEESDC